MTIFRQHDHRRPLSEIMDFDHVIEVHEDGTITTGPPHLHAPDLHDDELSSAGWELLNGYSGQDRYAGPIMHPSEQIGGRMERDIRETPGIYVALVAYYSPDEDDDPDDYDDVGGWAVARYTGEVAR